MGDGREVLAQVDSSPTTARMSLIATVSLALVFGFVAVTQIVAGSWFAVLSGLLMLVSSSLAVSVIPKLNGEIIELFADKVVETRGKTVLEHPLSEFVEVKRSYLGGGKSAPGAVVVRFRHGNVWMTGNRSGVEFAKKVAEVAGRE